MKLLIMTLLLLSSTTVFGAGVSPTCDKTMSEAEKQVKSTLEMINASLESGAIRRTDAANLRHNAVYLIFMAQNTCESMGRDSVRAIQSRTAKALSNSI